MSALFTDTVCNYVYKLMEYGSKREDVTGV